MPGKPPESVTPPFQDPDRIRPGEPEPIANLKPVLLAGQPLCSCRCGWFGPTTQRQSGACPSCTSTKAQKPSKASVHIYQAMVGLLCAQQDQAERTKGECLSLRSMLDQSVTNCRALQDAHTPLVEKAAALDAAMQLIGFAPDAEPSELPAAVQSIMADQLRYALHRDVLRLDPAAWDSIQDFPQQKVSATEYDHATDRHISRWRQIQQHQQRLEALRKEEARQAELAESLGNQVDAVT